MTTAHAPDDEKDARFVESGRRGGLATSPAKRRAARANAKKGGKPSKFGIGDRVVGKASAPVSYQGLPGRVVTAGPERGVYRVRFEGTRAAVRVRSWWLESA